MKNLFIALASISEHIVNVQKSQTESNQFFIQLNEKYTEPIAKKLHEAFFQLEPDFCLDIYRSVGKNEFTGMIDIKQIETKETICIEIIPRKSFNLTLTKKELIFIGSCIAEISNSKSHKGNLTIYDKTYNQSFINAISTKIELLEH